jgi:HlyD family secretion protein
MANNRKKKKLVKKIILGVVLMLIVVAIVGKTVARGGKDPTVKTVKPRIGSVVERLTETGNIELLRTVEVKSKIAGTVQKILAIEGERVKKGQVLCVVDPDPSQTLLLFQKRSTVDRSLIDLDRAKKELDRRRELAKTSMASPKELEDAENNHRLAQNAFNLSKLELEIMEKEIETAGSGAEERIVSSMVRSPIDGVITQRYIEEGVLVTSGISLYGAGTSLFQIGDPSAQIIKANISEVDIGKVKVGSPVKITLDAYPDTTFSGKIRHISPVGKLQTGRNVVSFNTEIEINDKDPRLQPGMSCDVDVILAEADSVIFLPLEAVYRKKEGSVEDRNEVTHSYIFVQAVKDTTKEKAKTGSKSKFAFFKKAPDPADNFTQKEVETGVKSESKIQIKAVLDTTMVLASDAEKMFKDKEAKKNGKGNKSGKGTDGKQAAK